MSKKKFPLFAIVLLVSILVGCTDVFDNDFHDDIYLPSVILKAKQYVESGKVDFSLLDMNKAYADDPEYAGKSNTADYSIKWGDYRVKTENNEDVVFVPIKINKKKHQAFSLLTEEGRFKGGSHQIYITMMLREGNYGDKDFDAAIGTYMYGHNMKDEDIMRMGLDFESANYNGYFILSALDGRMLTGRLYEEGKAKALFVQNPLSPKERKAKAKEKAQEKTTEIKGDTINNKKHEHLHIFLNYVPNRVFKKTKSGGDDIEWIITHCPYCGALWENCNCYTITACSHCGKNLNTNGLCPYACSWCGICLVGSPGHSHNSGNGGSGVTGGSGGTGGDGGTGGGPNPDPDPQPEPEHSIYPFTNLPMQERIDSIAHSAPRAIQAVKAIDAEQGRGSIPDAQQPMMCNYSVGKFYEELFGEVPDYLKHTESITENYYDFALANEWYDRVPNHPEEWGLIQGNLSDQVHIQAWLLEVQTMANEGYFVIGIADGIIKNGVRRPGHIVAVIPSPDGSLVTGDWDVDTPHTIDCGKGKRSSHTDLSNSFSSQSTWISKIRFYYHK